jgi:hypothetical protein
MIVFTKTVPDTDKQDLVDQHKVWLNSLHVNRTGINSKLIDDLLGAVAAQQKKTKHKKNNKT